MIVTIRTSQDIMKTLENKTFPARGASAKTQIPGSATNPTQPAPGPALVLMAALACMAVSVQGETIGGTGISSLPYTITNSGLYHLTKNFSTYNRTNGAAILIQLRSLYKDND